MCCVYIILWAGLCESYWFWLHRVCKTEVKVITYISLLGPNDSLRLLVNFLGFQPITSFIYLHMLMGGGEYFSVGGPGKGMYSRLCKLLDSWLATFVTWDIWSCTRYKFSFNMVQLSGFYHSWFRGLLTCLIILVFNRFLPIFASCF